MSRTVENPIGFGRQGARVANTPRGMVSRNGVDGELIRLAAVKCIDQDKSGKTFDIFEPFFKFFKNFHGTPDTPAPFGWIGIPVISVNGE